MRNWREWVKPTKAMPGFPLRPMRDFIYTAWLGQPNMSRGGIFLPSGQDHPDGFGRYNLMEMRFGVVCAVGPGYFNLAMHKFYPQPDVELGDVVMFSRKVGSRVPVDLTFQPPGWPVPMTIRVIDTEKALAVIDDFEPWWDIAESQTDPAGIMAG